MGHSTPGFPVHHQLPELAQTHAHWVGDSIQPSHLLSSCLQSFPASRSFPMSQLFTSGGQSIGAWASASVLSMNIQDWFPLGWAGWISLQSKGLSRVFSNTTVQKHQFFRLSAFFTVQLSHPYMTTGKTIALTRWTFVGKVMSLLFNMLSRLVIAFLPRSKCLLISWLQLPSAVILEPKEIKPVTVSTVSPSICCEVMGPNAMIIVFWMLSFKPTFSLSSFTFIKSLFNSSSLSAIRVMSSAYLRYEHSLALPFFGIRMKTDLSNIFSLVIEDLEQGSANYTFRQYLAPQMFLQIIFYWKTSVLISLSIAYGFLHFTVAESGSWNSDYVASKPKIFTHWSFTDKVGWLLVKSQLYSTE